MRGREVSEKAGKGGGGSKREKREKKENSLRECVYVGVRVKKKICIYVYVDASVYRLTKNPI